MGIDAFTILFATLMCEIFDCVTFEVNTKGG